MKKRILSAIVALAIVVPVIILGGKYYSFVIGLLAILAYKELLDLKENSVEIPNIIKAIGLIDLILLVFSEFDGYAVIFGLSYRAIAIYLISILIPTLF